MKALKFKGHSITLDDVDFRILEALQNDARQTYTAIGKNIGIAHSTVYDRVKRMEQHGVISKYTVVIDSQKAGTKNITAIMTIFPDPKESEKVATELCKAPQILEVYTSLSEELVIIAKVVAEDQESLHEFIAGSIAPLPGVLRIRTAIFTKKFKDTQYPITNNDKRYGSFEEEKWKTQEKKGFERK